MVMPRGLEPRISSLRGWRVIPVPLWHHINRQLFHSGSAPAFLSLTRTDTLNVFSRTILFLIRTFPLQIKRDIAGLSTTPPCTGKIRQVTPTTLSGRFSHNLSVLVMGNCVHPRDANPRLVGGRPPFGGDLKVYFSKK